MANQEACAQQPDSRVEAIRKQILSLSYDEINQLKFNLPPRPPAREVVVKVVRNPQAPKGRVLQVKQESDKIALNEQLVWSCPDGRLEIRFSRAQDPFAGEMYEVARGGKVFSGKPVQSPKTSKTYTYTFLVTTPDGYFLTLDWPITIIAAPGQTKVTAKKSAPKKK